MAATARTRGRARTRELPRRGNWSVFSDLTHPINWDTFLDDINLAQAAGVTAGFMAGFIVPRNFLPKPAAPPRITSGIVDVVNTNAALAAAIAAGNRTVRVTGDIAGIVNMQGTDVRIVHDEGVRVDTYAPGNAGECRRIAWVGGEIGAVTGVFANPTSDLDFDGCVFNGNVFTAGVPWQFTGAQRITMRHCVGRGGDPADLTGAFSILNTCDDVLVYDSNLSGSEGGGNGGNDWAIRHSGSHRVATINGWWQARGAAVSRFGGATTRGPKWCGSWSTPSARSTDRMMRYTQLERALCPQDTALNGMDSEFIYQLFGEMYADSLIANNFGLGGVLTPGAPYSLWWNFYQTTLLCPAATATAATVAARQGSQENPPEQWNYGVTVVNQAVSRTTPPTIFSQALLDAGYTGGEPFSQGVGNISDPYDCADV